MIMQEIISIKTQGRSTIDITNEVEKLVNRSGIDSGLCNLFIQHTSASLIVCENADPDVRTDLENFMQRMIRDGDVLFRHTTEGPDDMPAHIRNVLTSSSLTIPIAKGKCLLGTWQGIYLWEHRFKAHVRNIIVTIQGE
ncbi:MAG: secondary thiamine-phosphate synthase enzyme YjbQ [Gammaproteobacteria bacterium]|nr:secondary thiamine-phosphate synthase enzyme YjbQ [Gammaproteobacteria bacterium]MCK5498872.1 secondary thiamine-phosphate synthase enzyme YjbQ [Gammaproteobacteria bacterium]MCK5668571.1 secondary thiamine-phosphate synthase enzyme YjbQ [Gammaproteobacteria bacterium]